LLTVTVGKFTVSYASYLEAGDNAFWDEAFLYASLDKDPR